MNGFSGFGNESPLNKNIPVKKGESYKGYLDRAFKKTKDPYAQDVLGKKGYATQARQLKQDAKKKTRAVYKGIKKKITNVAKKFGASDKTIEKASRKLTKVKQTGSKMLKTLKYTPKQLYKTVGKAGPAGAAITAAQLAYPTIKKTAKETIKGLKERAKKEHETGFKNPGVRKL